MDGLTKQPGNTLTDPERPNEEDQVKEKEQPFPFRLPNLLESHQRRLAIQAQRQRNPQGRTTRLLFANFSRPQIRKPPKVEEPPPPEIIEVVEVAPAPVEVSTPQSRRRGRRGAFPIGNVGTGKRRATSTPPAASTGRVTPGASMKQNVKLKIPFPRSAPTQRKKVAASKPRSQPATAPQFHPQRDDRLSRPQTIPTDSFTPGRGATVNTGTPATTDGTKEPPRLRPASGRGFKELMAILCIPPGQSTSRRNEYRPPNRRRLNNLDANGLPRPKSHRRKKVNGPTCTPARYLQLRECDQIIAACEKYFLDIPPSIIHRALLRPEEIIRPPPGQPIMSTKKKSTSASTTDLTEKLIADPFEIRQRPPRRRSLYVKPLVTEFPTDSEVDLSELHNPKIDSWWTKSELKFLRNRLRNMKMRKSDGTWSEKDRLSVANAPGRPFSLSFAQSRYSFTPTLLPQPESLEAATHRSHSAFNSAKRPTAEYRKRHAMTADIYSRQLRKNSIAVTLPVVMPRRPISAFFPTLEEPAFPSSNRRPLWGITVALHG
ncbi:hypothetical protein DFS34DRAFT_363391 [Phlyctochytrium arcticum]|nr:hypothetical protein DFS34DRAFT_363391 [Phlyctochytrium arcticum]